MNRTYGKLINLRQRPGDETRGKRNATWCEHDARMLALGWVQKLTFFYRVWVMKDEPREEFTETEVHAFYETVDWVAWALHLPRVSDSFEEVIKLRHFVPVLRGGV